LDEPADRDDGGLFSDHDVRAALVGKGFENAELEWMRCSVKEVKTVLTELRMGQQFTGSHHQTFVMRREQTEAVNKTHAYFHSIWKEGTYAVPRFLWNAKMRFGKTFTTYQLAKKLGAKRVLVVTSYELIAEIMGRPDDLSAIEESGVPEFATCWRIGPFSPVEQAGPFGTGVGRARLFIFRSANGY
jgi:hypothetical protein